MDIETGPIRLIKPLTFLEDEGPAGAAMFAGSLETQDEFRERFLPTREVLKSYKTSLGYMIVHAAKKKAWACAREKGDTCACCINLYGLHALERLYVFNDRVGCFC